MKLPSIDRIASFDVDSQRTFTPMCPDELPVEGGETIGPELGLQATGFQSMLNLAARSGIAPDSTRDALEEMRSAGIETFDGVEALERQK